MSSLTYPGHLQLATLALAEGAEPTDVGLGTGWTLVDHAIVLGHGKECLAAATDRLRGWRAHAHAGVRVSREGRLVRLSLGPTLSPCLILAEEYTGTSAVLVYGTLPGHILSGEEAFLITLAEDGTVTGRCVAFSRLSWWLARLGAPVARRVQRVATRRYVDGMRP